MTAVSATRAPTFQEIMDTKVDPSADAIWDSVAYIATRLGVEDRQPRTDEQWRAVRRSALTLIEGADLLRAKGSRVALVDTEAKLGELQPSEIQRRIDATPMVFEKFARALGNAGTKALAAIDARDAKALMDAGGTIDEACEACHLTYCYPKQ
jgi:hypothetical protein